MISLHPFNIITPAQRIANQKAALLRVTGPVIGSFPNEALLLRLACAVLMELSEEWETGKRRLNMDVENDNSASEQRRIYRKNVA